MNPQNKPDNIIKERVNLSGYGGSEFTKATNNTTKKKDNANIPQKNRGKKGDESV